MDWISRVEKRQGGGLHGQNIDARPELAIQSKDERVALQNCSRTDLARLQQYLCGDWR